MRRSILPTSIYRMGFKMATVATTNLLYAAFLESLGGEVSSTESCGRYTKVFVNVPDYAIPALKDKTSRLSRLANRCESAEELEVVFNSSILSDVETKYFRLKRTVSRGKR